MRLGLLQYNSKKPNETAGLEIKRSIDLQVKAKFKPKSFNIPENFVAKTELDRILLNILKPQSDDKINKRT